MKKLFLLASFMLSTAVFSHSASATITRSCEAAFFSSPTSWYADCWMWVQSEPEIVGATQIEVRNNTYGTVFQGGSQLATPSYTGYGYGFINLTQVSPGVYVMSANASRRNYAYKWSDSPTNSMGVTWDPLCAAGKYSYYQNGTGWIYVSGYDTEDCTPSAITTE